MLHWPDSMMTFFCNDNVLFSQDNFGMHLATLNIFTDGHSKGILDYESSKYFANILLPYSPLILKMLKQLTKLNIKINMIAPDHGPIWNKETSIQWILESYKRWSIQKPNKKAVFLYDTIQRSTFRIAEFISDRLAKEGVPSYLMDVNISHRSNVMTELLNAGILVIGSTEINSHLPASMSDMLCYIKGLSPKNLIGQAFLSYKKSSSPIFVLQQALKDMAVRLIADPILTHHSETNESLSNCHTLAHQLSEHIRDDVF